MRSRPLIVLWTSLKTEVDMFWRKESDEERREREESANKKAFERAMQEHTTTRTHLKASKKKLEELLDQLAEAKSGTPQVVRTNGKSR